MVLLNVLHSLARQNRWRLVVGHFNHRLRGRSSHTDARFVAKAAADMGVPCELGEADVREVAKRERLSIEMAARQERHRFLARIAVRRRCRFMATGHHADDQVELFFIRLLRGAGPQGLGGMRHRGPSPGNAKLTLVRPLLDLTRAEIEAHAREHKLGFREDQSNQSPAFLRNRLRHALLPLLKRDFQASLETTISRSMELLRTDSDYLDLRARDWLIKRGPGPFQQLHLAIRRRCVLLQLRELAIEPEFGLIERLLEQPCAWVSCNRQEQVRLTEQGQVELGQIPRMRFSGDAIALDLSSGEGDVVFGGMRFSWRRTPIQRHRVPPCRPGRECFDAEAVGESVLLRHWQPGDRFQPIGMKHAVKVQDLLTNQKVPAERRRALVLAEASDGGIFWIQGLRIGDRYKLSRSTVWKLAWSYEDA